MREIKFRVWNKYGMSDPFTLKYISEYDSSVDGKGKMFWPEPTEFMQYTGLKDKNGKEIYEGDVLKCFHEGDEIGNLDQITFQDGAFFLRYRYRTVHSWIEWDGKFEVTGNIYENPNLLQ